MKCDKCKGKMSSPATGNCTSCGSGTPVRQDKLCVRCSVLQKKCARCLTDLSGQGGQGQTPTK